MSSLAMRLREIVTARPAADAGASPPALAAPSPRAAGDVAETLGGSWIDADGQPYLVVDRTYGPGHRHGRVAMMDCLPPWPRLPLLRSGPEPSAQSPEPTDRLLFLDLETTGLAGGAGTYAFLVGCAWFDRPVFRVRQFFLSAFAAERALLAGLTSLADGINGVVSFNGKTFDLPVIETRFLLHRVRTPFADLPHVDMLHPARRLWRAAEDERSGPAASCRLSALEQGLCGVAREGDVPGFEIPSRYFHYVRTGDARPLEGVLEHNRLDLISLAVLTARAAQLLETGPSDARSAREALGVGRLYERGGLCDLAREAYRTAAGFKPADFLTQAEALRSYAVICRRQRLHGEAADAWRRILSLRACPPRIAREAAEALAVHHEHRLRDPGSARQFALQSLGFDGSPSRQHVVHHRLARLERKLGGPATYALQF